jgi:hypothetical protein
MPHGRPARTVDLWGSTTGGDVEHLGDEVGQHDASLRRQLGDAQPRLACACGNVEMLMILRIALEVAGRGV